MGTKALGSHRSPARPRPAGWTLTDPVTRPVPHFACVNGEGELAAGFRPSGQAGKGGDFARMSARCSVLHWASLGNYGEKNHTDTGSGLSCCAGGKRFRSLYERFIKCDAQINSSSAGGVTHANSSTPSPDDALATQLVR